MSDEAVVVAWNINFSKAFNTINNRRLKLNLM